MSAQPVVIDEEETSFNAMTKGAGISAVPNINLQGQNWKTTSLKWGIVRYTTTNSVTGSAQTLNMVIPKPHKLLRIEYQQIVTSTGAPDTTGLAVKFSRLNGIQGTGAVALLNQANVAQSDIVFLFGEPWQADSSTYQHIWTGQNNDTLTIDVYVIYL